MAPHFRNIAPHFRNILWVSKMTSLAPLAVTRRGGNEFVLDKIYATRIFCDKIGSVSFFWGWNGVQNILLPPIGGRHRLLCFMTNPK